MTCLRYCFFILCLLPGLLASMAAVPAEAHSTVTDADDGMPVAGAIVQSTGKEGKVLSFGRTDASGRFSLTLRPGTASVTIRAMGYESITLSADSIPETISLTRKATELHEVIVKAPDIYAKGDTLVFSVDRFAKAGDNAIIDVIKRLPGVKVKDDGTIEYQGKPINRFYIDGNDFIGGQYGLATENISHKDVKSVEVMENHQPVKALEGIEFPEEAGLNLKLKEDARGRWTGVATAGTGAQPVLYDASVFGMRIAPGLQGIFRLRSADTGWDPAQESGEHGFDDMFGSDYNSSPWPEYIMADIIGTTLAARRTRDNLSWLANGVTAWRKGDTSMRLTADYTGDRLDYAISTGTHYFSAGIPDFVMRNTMRTMSQGTSLQFNAEVNRRGYYLKDRLTVEGERDRSRSAISGTLDLLQRVRRNSLTATNDLKLVKRNDKRLFTLMSRNSFSHTPALLVIGDTMQRADITDLRSTTELRHGWFAGWWKVYIHAGADIGYRRTSLSLDGLGGYDNSGTYGIFTSEVYATPRMDYDRGRWRVSISLPASWKHYGIRGSHNYASLSPVIYARRQLSARSDLSATARYRLSPEAPYMFVEAPMLRDYRNLSELHPCGGTQEVSGSATYRYRNPIDAMFANLTVSYARTISQNTPDRIFDGELVISTYVARVSATEKWSAEGGVSKGFGHGRILAGLDATFSSATGTSMTDGIPMGCRQHDIQARPYLKGTLVRNLAFDYEARIGFSTMSVEDAERSDYTTLTQRLSAIYTLHDNLHLTAGAEHYLTRPDGSATSDLILLDASASWQMTPRLRLSLTCSNLLDSREYRYVSYGTLSESTCTYRLRPRNILATAQLRF